MKAPLLLSLALLAVPSVASAKHLYLADYEAPEQQCHEAGEAAYQLAAARGHGSPDVPSLRAQELCLWKAYRNHLIASRSVTLNDLVDFDHAGDSFIVEAGWN